MSDETSAQRTAKKKRQRRRVAARARAGAALAQTAEQHFDDLPGPVKAAVGKYREATKPAKAAKR